MGPVAAECRWDEPSGPRRATLTVVSAARALEGWYCVVEMAWTDAQGVEGLRHIQVHAKDGRRALRKCVRWLAATVGPLRTSWTG